MELRRVRGRPLWTQVRDRVLAEIDSGKYKAGDKLPTEREYADEFGVSLNPVRTALAELVSIGAIERINGRGTFVLSTHSVASLQLLRSTTESLRAHGIEFEVTVHDDRLVDLAAMRRHTSLSLELDDDAEIWFLERTISIDGIPAIHLRNWLAAARRPEVSARTDFAGGGSLYRALSDIGAAPVSSHADVSIDYATDVVAARMDLPFGSPLLALNAVTVGVDAAPVDVSQTRYNTHVIGLSLEQTLPYPR